MHGLKSDIDLSFLLNKEIAQICLGKYQIILRLSESVEISIEGRMKYTSRSGPYKEVEILCSDVHAGILQNLFEIPIVQIGIQSPGDLLLEFENRDELLIFDSNPQTESYQLSFGNRTIVV
jgi:hypothetical protein